MNELDFYEDWAQYKKKPYTFPYKANPWNEWAKPFQLQRPVVKEFSILPPNKILLGFSTNPKNYGQPCYLNFNPNRRITIIISGDNDSGKTTFLKSIGVDGFHGRFGLPIIWIDPKGDGGDIQYPNTEPNFIKILNDLTMRARGYKMLELFPKFAGMVGAKGLEFTLSLSDLKGTSKSETLTNLANYIGLEGDDPSIPLLGSALFSDNPPQTIAGLLAFVQEMKEQGLSTRAEKLPTRLNYLKMTDQLGDVPTNFPKLLKENGILILRVPLKKERNVNVTDLIASAFLGSVINDREIFARTGGGYTNMPPVAIMSEANKYAGLDTATNDLITQITTKFRAINNFVGMYSILDVQHVSDLDEQQVLEADLIFGTRLTYPKDIELLTKRAGFNIHTMQSTEFIKDVHPKEFWGINKNGGIVTFKPIPICSRMVQPKATDTSSINLSRAPTPAI